MTLAGQISPSHGAVWSPQEVGRSESSWYLTKSGWKSGYDLTKSGVCVGGRRGLLYYVIYMRARRGTRIRDRVGVKMTDAKTIWPIAYNAPLSEREHNKLISKAKRKRRWDSMGRKMGIRWAEREGERKGGRAFAPRAHVHAREQLPPVHTAGLTGHPPTGPAPQAVLPPAVLLTCPFPCPVPCLPFPAPSPVSCSVVPLTSIPPSRQPKRKAIPRQSVKP